MPLTRLINQHQVILARFNAAVRTTGAKENEYRINGLEAQLEFLERKILEHPARTVGELYRKLNYIYLLTQRNRYVAELLQEAVERASVSADTPPR